MFVPERTPGWSVGVLVAGGPENMQTLYSTLRRSSRQKGQHPKAIPSTRRQLTAPWLAAVVKQCIHAQNRDNTSEIGCLEIEALFIFNFNDSQLRNRPQLPHTN